MANTNLKEAKAAKNDEFYTQFHDIEIEMNAYLLVLLVGISIVSCTNDLDEMLGTQNLQTRSVEPRFTGNISESQAIALMNEFLDAPSFFYFEDVKV